MAKERFYVVDPNLKNLMGHYFEYDRCLVEPVRSRGYELITLGSRDVVDVVKNAMPVVPAFSRSIWDTFLNLERVPRYGSDLSHLASNLDFYRVLSSYLSGGVLGPKAVVFSHMIRPHQLLAWTWWLRRLPSADRPRLVLLLRYAAEWFANNKFAERAFRALEQLSGNADVRLATDSARLAADYSHLTRLPITVFPIPHTNHPLVNGSRQRLRSSESTHLISLGNARDEKGILEILRAIRLLHMRGDLGRLCFTLQVNDIYAPYSADEIRARIAEIKRLALPNITFIESPMSTAEYYDLLNSADVVMLPYWRSIYQSRTSGIFAEALGAAKAVIATEDTWMSDQVVKHGAGVVCRDRDPVALTHAILEVHSERGSYSLRARDAQRAWLSEHNPDVFVEAILKTARAPSKKKVGLLYPWGDLQNAERQAGASRRFGLLLDYLSARYEELRVLAPGGWQDFQKSNVRYLSFRPSWGERKLLMLARGAFRALVLILTMGRVGQEDIMLWYHLVPHFQPSLRRKIKEVVQWADVVLVEYPFWAHLARTYARPGCRLILTNYDVLANQVVRNHLLKRLTIMAEAGGLRQADAVVCVSRADQQTFKRYGIESEVIPHPYGPIAAQSYVFSQTDKTMRLRIPGLEESRTCLFVGSYFDANLQAVRAIRVIARAMRERFGENFCEFVIVGGCAEPENRENLTALGRIESIHLELLYRAATMVLIPLPFGTGASVKTIEALAHGKPVLGTSAAFRGFPVAPGVHCEVEDDLGKYPDLIADLLRAPDRCAKLGNFARQFAAAYDYETVFARYMQLIEGQGEGRSLTLRADD